MIQVIGGGLAGCEAAWQLAERGHDVALYEMRPVRNTPAHRTEDLAELVCTNSFKSEDVANAHGLLKAEMRALGSLLLQCADDARVPGGSALVVERERFSAAVSDHIARHPRIRVVRDEVRELPSGPAVIATGPLTSDALTDALLGELGGSGLAFYDSIAPIVSGESVDLDYAFFASRWDKGDGADYLNCPLERDEYLEFLAALREADRYAGHEWETLPHQTGDVPYFEGCLPLEVMAERGDDTLRFGPFKPVGLRNPRTGRRAYAVLQLRREDANGQMWNLVGCQTRMRTGEQKRVFRTIPALRDAEFLRWGSIHRNTYLNFPRHLAPYGAPQGRPLTLVAGQLTGVEGYTESAASGILAGINLDRLLSGADVALPPATTMLGALMRYLRDADPARFQPMNSNFGLLDPLQDPPRDKGARRQALVDRAQRDLEAWLESANVAPLSMQGALG